MFSPVVILYARHSCQVMSLLFFGTETKTSAHQKWREAFEGMGLDRGGSLAANWVSIELRVSFELSSGKIS